MERECADEWSASRRVRMGSGADGEVRPLAAAVAAEVSGLPIEVTAHGDSCLTARCTVPGQQASGGSSGAGAADGEDRAVFEVSLQVADPLVGAGVFSDGDAQGGRVRVTRLEPEGFYDASEFGGWRSACEAGTVGAAAFLRGWCRYCVAASDRGEVFRWVRGRYPGKGGLADTRSALVLLPGIARVLSDDGGGGVGGGSGGGEPSADSPGLGGYFELELRWKVTVDAQSGEVGHDLNLVPSASPDVWAEDVEGVLASLDEEFPGLVELQGPKRAIVTIMDSLDPLQEEEEEEERADLVDAGGPSAAA